MILDIREKNRGELNRLRRKLRIKPDGETEAMDNVGKYFLREISEEAKERVRVLMIEPGCGRHLLRIPEHPRQRRVIDLCRPSPRPGTSAHSPLVAVPTTSLRKP